MKLSLKDKLIIAILLITIIICILSCPIPSFPEILSVEKVDSLKTGKLYLNSALDTNEWKPKWFSPDHFEIEISIKYSGIFTYHPTCVFESKTQYKLVNPDIVFEKSNLNYIKKIEPKFIK